MLLCVRALYSFATVLTLVVPVVVSSDRTLRTLRTPLQNMLQVLVVGSTKSSLANSRDLGNRVQYIISSPASQETLKIESSDPRDLKNNVWRKSSPATLETSKIPSSLPDTFKIETSASRDLKNLVQRRQRPQQSSLATSATSKIEWGDLGDLKSSLATSETSNIESSDLGDFKNRGQRPRRPQKRN